MALEADCVTGSFGCVDVDVLIPTRYDLGVTDSEETGHREADGIGCSGEQSTEG